MGQAQTGGRVKPVTGIPTLFLITEYTIHKQTIKKPAQISTETSLTADCCFSELALENTK